MSVKCTELFSFDLPEVRGHDAVAAPAAHCGCITLLPMLCTSCAPNVALRAVSRLGALVGLSGCAPGAGAIRRLHWRITVHPSCGAAPGPASPPPQLSDEWASGILPGSDLAGLRERMLADQAAEREAEQRERIADAFTAAGACACRCAAWGWGWGGAWLVRKAAPAVVAAGWRGVRRSPALLPASPVPSITPLQPEPCSGPGGGGGDPRLPAQRAGAAAVQVRGGLGHGVGCSDVRSRAQWRAVDAE